MAQILQQYQNMQGPQLAEELEAVVGRTIAAKMSAATQNKDITRWQDGRKKPEYGNEQRMRVALSLILSMREVASDDEIIGFWSRKHRELTGKNTPATTLGKGDLETVARMVDEFLSVYLESEAA